MDAERRPRAPRTRVDNAMVKALARAFRWRKMLDTGAQEAHEHPQKRGLARAVRPAHPKRFAGGDRAAEVAQHRSLVLARRGELRHIRVNPPQPAPRPEDPMTVFVGTDTAKTRRDLQVGERTYAYYSIAAAEAANLGDFSKLPASLKVVLENMLRFEDGKTVTLDDIRAFSDWAASGGKQPARDRLPAGARADAGLHRGARGGRSRRDARCYGGFGRRSAEDQPAESGRPGDRPLGDGRRVRQRRARSR